MPKNDLDLKFLTDQLLEEVRSYGILEVSQEQYIVVCNAIIKFAARLGEPGYSQELMRLYKNHLNDRVTKGDICPEYRRFQFRVVRMIISLAETGNVDFSSTRAGIRKYPVNDEGLALVEKILDSHPVSEKTKADLRAPIRHLFWYAAEQGVIPEYIDDIFIMEFLISEVPVSNSGSTGRTLRCIKYVTEYLKQHGNTGIRHDYTLLKLKNDHRRIIPAYSEKEISNITSAINPDTPVGKKDLAIILLAYCTGLRGTDIIHIKLSDIDWREQKISVVQSKTHTPLIAELNGMTLNALADYVLEARPECNVPELFVTVKAPYHKLEGGLDGMIEKYCKQAGVRKIPFRSFHSLRRAFETVMVLNGVPIETASQMMGHKTIKEDKPYITHDKRQVAFVAMGFSDVPVTTGIYVSIARQACSRKGGGTK